MVKSAEDGRFDDLSHFRRLWLFKTKTARHFAEEKP